jgi:hypothetical protein
MIYMMPKAKDTTKHSNLSKLKRVRTLVEDDNEDRPKKRQRFDKLRTAKHRKPNDVGIRYVGIFSDWWSRLNVIVIPLLIYPLHEFDYSIQSRTSYLIQTI